MDYNSAMFNLHKELIELQSKQIVRIAEAINDLRLLMGIILIMLFCTGVACLWKRK